MPRHKHGFTIIEVSLVLAIAGLILVMAFVALPTLQRQARDAKRKEDTMIFLQALKKYQQNNRGNLPNIENFNNNGISPSSIVNYKDKIVKYNTWSSASDTSPWVKFYNQYLGDSFISPEGEKYTFLIQDLAKAFWTYSDIATELANEPLEKRYADFYIFPAATCNDGKPQESSNPRNLAIVTLLETGTYCADM